MKTFISVLAGALALFHLSLALFPLAANPLLIHAGSALVALAILLISAASKPVRPAPPTPAPLSKPLELERPPLASAIAPPPPPPVARPEAPRAEAEVVAFLALLQEKGRLVDFVREDVTGASDEQLGAAARVVHSGCRAVFNEYLEITPVRAEAEGAKVTLAAGFDSAAHRLLGSVPAKPPYSGKLLHPGWAVRAIRLPRVTGTTVERPWPVLAPAEIEMTKV